MRPRDLSLTKACENGNRCWDKDDRTSSQLYGKSGLLEWFFMEIFRRELSSVQVEKKLKNV